MKRCPKCNIEYTNDFIFCSKCGNALVEIESDEPEVEAIEAEVIEEKSEPHREDPLIEQYQQEIKLFEYRRKSLMITGIVTFAVSLILTVIFGALFIIQFAQEAQAAGGGEFQMSELLMEYELLFVASSVINEVGIVLFVLGIVPNTIKINNRKRYINSHK